jgi:hypothetical protein
MSNTKRSLAQASRYARLAELAPSPELQSGRRQLEALWREIAAAAESFDRGGDGRERIYEMIDEVARRRESAG